MKFSKWLRILAVSGCIAATAVSAGAFSCSDFERSGGGLIKKRWMHSMRIWLPEKVQMISWRVR